MLIGVNKKGFTLVELLAVLVLIGTITTIAFTSISGLIGRQKTKEYEGKCDLFLAKAEEYFNDNKNDIDINQGPPAITLKDLVESGYVKSGIINPKENTLYDVEQTVFNIAQDEVTGKYYFNKEFIEGKWEAKIYVNWCK